MSPPDPRSSAATARRSGAKPAKKSGLSRPSALERAAAPAIPGTITYTWEIAGNRIRWLSGLLEVAGYAPGSGSGGPGWWRVRIHPEDRPAYRLALAAALEKGGELTIQYRARAADGRWLDLLDRAVVERSGTDRPVRLIGAMTEVSQVRSRSERALRQDLERLSEKDRARDEFLDRAAHKLRTPLSTILIWLTALRQSDLEPDKAEHALAVIERSVRSLAELLDEFQDISSILAGRLRLDPLPFDLGAVVCAALERTRALAEAKSVALDMQLAAPRAIVAGDPERLQQVMRHLVSNAIRFTPEGGRVVARLTLNGAEARVEVCDTGSGIAPEQLDTLFERFGNPSGTGGGGLGVGLSVSRELVRLHGGSLEAASPGVGRGSTFTVRVPLHSGKAFSSHASWNAAESHASIHETPTTPPTPDEG